MANAPHNWLKAAVETASGITAWPVEMTGGGDPPYAIYTREATDREQLGGETLDDTTEPDTVYVVSRFTVVIYADSYAQAWEIAGRIANGDGHGKPGIHTFSGTAHGETIERCFVLDERDGDAGFLEGREQPTYTVEQNVEIRFSEE